MPDFRCISVCLALSAHNPPSFQRSEQAYRSRADSELKHREICYVNVNKNVLKEGVMGTASIKRWLIAATCLVAFAGTGQVLGNEGLEKLMKDPNYWVTPSGDYSNLE